MAARPDDQSDHTLAQERGSDQAATPWMSPEQAARYLGIALGTLRNWTSARYIPFARRGRVVRYHRDAIDKWLGRGACTGRSRFAQD